MSDPEFNNQPKPADWILPDEVEKGLDPLDRAILSEHEWDGVPIPLAMSFTLSIAEKLEGLGESDDLSSFIDELAQHITQEQARYPNSPIWDRARTLVVNRLIGVDKDQEAMEFAWTIGNPHMAVEKLMDIVEVTDGEAISAMIKGVLTQENPERAGALLRAFRDRIIETSPNTGADSLAIFNNALELSGYEVDHVKGWADSQRILHPDWDWDLITGTIAKDGM